VPLFRSYIRSALLHMKPEGDFSCKKVAPESLRRALGFAMTRKNDHEVWDRTYQVLHRGLEFFDVDIVALPFVFSGLFLDLGLPRMACDSGGCHLCASPRLGAIVNSCRKVLVENASGPCTPAAVLHALTAHPPRQPTTIIFHSHHNQLTAAHNLATDIYRAL
jgi:hypothetical protein